MADRPFFVAKYVDTKRRPSARGQAYVEYYIRPRTLLSIVMLEAAASRRRLYGHA